MHRSSADRQSEKGRDRDVCSGNLRVRGLVRTAAVVRRPHPGYDDEDQQLGSTFDGRPHREPDSTIPAVPSPTSRAGRLSTTWPSPPESADLHPGDLLRRAAARRRR